MPLVLGRKHAVHNLPSAHSPCLIYLQHVPLLPQSSYTFIVLILQLLCLQLSKPGLSFLPHYAVVNLSLYLRLHCDLSSVGLERRVVEAVH